MMLLCTCSSFIFELVIVYLPKTEELSCPGLPRLTLWGPLLPYGYGYKASRARPG